MSDIREAIIESMKKKAGLDALRKRVEIAAARALVLLLPAKFEQAAEKVSTYIKQEFFRLLDSRMAIAQADAFVKDHARAIASARATGPSTMLPADLLYEMAQALPGIRSPVGRWLYCKYIWNNFKKKPFDLQMKSDKGMKRLLGEMYIQSIDAIREPKSFEEILDCASGSYVALGMYALNEKKIHAILSTVFLNTFIQGGIGPRKDAGTSVAKLVDAPVNMFIDLYSGVKRKLFEAYAKEYGISNPDVLSNDDLVRVVRIFVQDKKTISGHLRWPKIDLLCHFFPQRREVSSFSNSPISLQ
nr:hypothetical protein [Candidatus Sigynarchaeota archaeon]